MLGNPYKEQESEQHNKSRKSKTELKNLYMQQESRSTSRKYTRHKIRTGIHITRKAFEGASMSWRKFIISYTKFLLIISLRTLL